MTTDSGSAQADSNNGQPTELASLYDPAQVEGPMYDLWQEGGHFHADPAAGGDPYAIVIPPPNVTAALHLGHALNNTLQDNMIRWRRMMGCNTLWMPGTDHAGIATQTVVEKRILAEEGKRRTDFQRDEFIGRVQNWKDEYEARILGQLKAMGCSCDWERTRFTMDATCARAVREAFFKLFSDGLIYRGKRLVNWDPATQTVLADDEVEHQTVEGSFWYLQYPLEHPVEINGQRLEHVTVATTRPETMLGDTAVAMNPNDPRAAALVGKVRVRLPIVGRLIPIVADDHVVMADPESEDEKAKFSTGFLKVTPAHDPNDWAIGQRHNLPAINVMAPDGSISYEHGWTDWDEVRNADVEQLIGLDRFEAREAIVNWFRGENLLEDVRPHAHEVGHSYRSHVPVEPYLSDQWFIAVKKQIPSLPDAGLIAGTDVPVNSLAGLALKPLLEGRVRFVPERYTRTYQTWLENLRDWPISRQLWWGHRIPVWRGKAPESPQQTDWQDVPSSLRVGDADLPAQWRTEQGEVYVYVVAPPNRPDVEQKLDEMGFAQDADVLDTWFSSGLWPISTMGWPEETDALNFYYPTNVLCTAREIITLWVSRMVMFGQYFRGDIPFSTVFIHAMIQDGEGRKMSKSLGNGIDPLDIIASHGADAMRFTLSYMTTETQDVRMPVAEMTLPDGRKANSSPKFDNGRNFCNKLWNSGRFVMMNLAEMTAGEFDRSQMQLEDRWILSRLMRTVDEATQAMENYRFHDCLESIYSFFWSDFCDWYLEVTKPRMRDEQTRLVPQRILAYVLDSLLRLLHPFVPYITEALWQHLGQVVADRSLDAEAPAPPARACVVAAWPKALQDLRNDDAEADFAQVQRAIRAIRNIRSRMNIAPRQPLTAIVRAGEDELARLNSAADTVRHLASLERLETSATAERPRASAMEVVETMQVYVPLEGVIDLDQERERLGKQIAEKEKFIGGSQNKLANESFVSRAKPEVVEAERERLGRLQEELAVLQANLKDLQ